MCRKQLTKPTFAVLSGNAHNDTIVAEKFAIGIELNFINLML